MMYEMRNDFQYGRFKPIALEFLNISEKMRKPEEKNKINNAKKENNPVYQNKIKYDTLFSSYSFLDSLSYPLPKSMMFLSFINNVAVLTLPPLPQSAYK